MKDAKQIKEEFYDQAISGLMTFDILRALCRRHKNYPAITRSIEIAIKSCEAWLKKTD